MERTRREYTACRAAVPRRSTLSLGSHLRYLHARSRASGQPLSAENIGVVLAKLLPRGSNYRSPNCQELLGELRHFKLWTKGDLRRLVLRHRRQAIAIDRSPLDSVNTRIFRSEWGVAEFNERIRTGTWFSWEGLVRIILELEFGDGYRSFASERDRT